MNGDVAAGVRGILFDLDGVFYVENQLIPGATATVDFLLESGIPFCFVTNTINCKHYILHADAVAERLTIGYLYAIK